VTTVASGVLGIRIAFYREKRGLTQEGLARRAWIHRVTLANIERGAEQPTVDTLQRIARALRVPVGDLLK
jgi:transcriptional regulator with XRE-family HTH domain